MEPVTRHYLNATEGSQQPPAPETNDGGSDNTPQPGRSAAVGCIYDANGSKKDASSLLPGFVDAGSAGSKY